MKKILLTTLLAIGSTLIFAQEKETPRSEFTVDLSSASVEINPGQTKTVDISINRSKMYSKAKASLKVSSGLPEGVTITFEPAEGLIDNSKATITVSTNAKTGNYMIILNTVMQNKNKGKTLKLTIGEGTSSASLK